MLPNLNLNEFAKSPPIRRVIALEFLGALFVDVLLGKHLEQTERTE